jgi:hypothetical protein
MEQALEQAFEHPYSLSVAVNNTPATTASPL